MRKIFYIIIVLLLTKQLAAQDITVSNINSNEIFNEIRRNVKNETSESFYELTKAVHYFLKSNFALNEFKLNNNEKIIFFSNKYQVTSLSNESKLQRTLIKYDFESKNELNKINLPLEGELKFVNQNGDFVFITYGDGEAFQYDFYDRDFNHLNSYKPYESGFMFTKFDFNNENSVIITQKGHSSNMFKISILENFKVNLEKEIDIAGYSISNVKMLKNQVVILINGKESLVSKLLCFDYNLSLLWEKELKGRLYGNELNINPNIDKIFFINKHELFCLNSTNGQINWNFPINENNYRGYKISAAIIENGGYFIINKGDYSRKEGIYKNNVIRIIEISTGKLISTENIGNTENMVEIVSVDKSFFLLKSTGLVKYQFEK